MGKWPGCRSGRPIPANRWTLRIASGTVAKAYTELADCGIIDTGAGRAARVKRVKPIPEPLVRAAKTYADEARRLGASLDDAFNALCAQW